MSWFDFLKGSPVPQWARPKDKRYQSDMEGKTGYRTTYDIQPRSANPYGDEPEDAGFRQDGEVMETTPALSNMMQRREVERYGRRAENLEDAKELHAGANKLLQSRWDRMKGKELPKFPNEWMLQDAKNKERSARMGFKEYEGNRDYMDGGSGVAYGDEGHIVERMPRPEVSDSDLDSHDTMEGGAGYGQGGYTSLYEENPDWFKNVKG